MHHSLITKYYFIHELNTKNIDKLDKQTIVIFRNYASINQNEKLLLKIKKYCKIKGIKFYLSNNVKLAIKLNLDGAYIPSFNKNFNHLSYSYKKEFDLIGSAHNWGEIKIKEIQSVKKIVLSSLFKKNKNFLGLNRFRLLSNFTKNKIIVLGGISKKNLRKLKLLGNPEFAGISFFEQKKGP